MGSVKDLITADHPAASILVMPTYRDFGLGGWRVKGTYSVKDMKELIPESDIAGKAEALTMQTAAFFEWLGTEHPEIPTCYVGILDSNRNRITDLGSLLQKGERSNIIVMKLAHIPETFVKGEMRDAERLSIYRQAIRSGELQCAVADVESIFRKGFPLGSSTFEKIFKAVGWGDTYEVLATYDETAAALKIIRELVEEKGLGNFPELEQLLQDYGLGTTIPNPGFVLKDMAYDSTTKFEKSGDRFVTKAEEKELSGLSPEGYDAWTQEIFPKFAAAQIRYCDERNILNIDGKGECVTYQGSPVVTDFACTVDENREMIIVDIDGVEFAIPSNKEIQRAIFKKAGVDVAKREAIELAERAGDKDTWKQYMPERLKARGIDLKAVSDYSCELMGYAIAEVANRTFGMKVFDAKPLDTWVRDFVPYASRIERQE